MRSRLAAAVTHALTAFVSGAATEVAMGDTWLSAQALPAALFDDEPAGLAVDRSAALDGDRLVGPGRGPCGPGALRRGRVTDVIDALSPVRAPASVGSSSSRRTERTDQFRGLVRDRSGPRRLATAGPRGVRGADRRRRGWRAACHSEPIDVMVTATRVGSWRGMPPAPHWARSASKWIMRSSARSENR